MESRAYLGQVSCQPSKAMAVRGLVSALTNVLSVPVRTSEIQSANGNAGVKVRDLYGCDGCVSTPAAGQEVLVPPCIWAEGCRAIIQLNAITSYEALQYVLIQKFNASAYVPAVQGSGRDIGPGQIVYVQPCLSVCCFNSIFST